MANISVIYGSVRKNRQGIKAAKFFVNKLEERGHKATLVDPLEFNLPFIDKMYKEYEKGKAPENLEKLAEIFRNSDGFIVVTAEYNHSTPPALNNLIDYFMVEYLWKPSGIVCYSVGSFGGVRAAMQLRTLLPEVGMPTIPSIFPIPKVQDAFDDNGKALGEAYNKRVKKFLDEFDWHVNAFKNAREKGVPY